MKHEKVMDVKVRKYEGQTVEQVSLIRDVKNLDKMLEEKNQTVRNF